jgi:endonuclease YncB( thermonuclease family)
LGEAWWAKRQAQSQPQADSQPTPPVVSLRTEAPSRQSPQAVQPPRQPQQAVTLASPHALPQETAPSAPKPAQATDAEQHVAALKERDKSGAPAKTESKLYHRVKVRDRGTLQAGYVVIKLAGIAAHGAEENCKDEKGKDWPCGKTVKTELSRLIRARAVTCLVPAGGAPNTVIARCSVAGTDLSAWLVRQGWAVPDAAKDPALIKEAEAAQGAKLGVWRPAP